ncbi:hypothetical protein L1887_00895 [Cichorium endivia]|nr:hypothetical protein L1887_00895 [Cichorium endivia]
MINRVPEEVGRELLVVAKKKSMRFIQCGRLNRSNCAGSQNPKLRRSDYEKTGNDEALDHHHRHTYEVRVLSPSRMRYHRSCSNERVGGSERIINISPGRRSESPFRSSNNGMVYGSSISRLVKMVPVPATPSN